MHTRRAFTLVEAIVVVVLLGVLAGLTAPRLFSNDDRRAETAVRSVSAVLGVIAQRETLGTVRMALVYDASLRTIGLERLELPTDRDGRLVALTRRDSGQWRSDPLAPSVSINPARITMVRVDGEEIDARDEWRVEFVPGEPRPLIEIDMSSTFRGRERTWRVELLPYASEADRWSTSGANTRRTESLQSQDLDAVGLSEIPW